MDEEKALLAAIIANPDEDTPRLVYADWLDENGEPDRAEFVRVQCELAKEPPEHHPDCPKTRYFSDGNPDSNCPRCAWVSRHRGGGELRRRMLELFHADDNRTLAWFGLPQPCARIARLEPFHGTQPHNYPYAVVRRGFVESITCTAADWLAHCDAIRRAHPVTAVVLTTVPETEVEFGSRFRWRIRGRERWYDAVKERTSPVGMEIGCRIVFPAVAEMLAGEWSGVAFTLPPDDQHQ